MPSHKNSIQLTILQNGNGQYVAQEGKVKPIGNKRKKNVFWDITNRTNNPIVVTILKFNHKPPCDSQSPCSCPLEDKGDFKNCAARDLRIDDQEGNRTRTIEAKISEDAGSCYTYELLVAKPQPIPVTASIRSSRSTTTAFSIT